MKEVNPKETTRASAFEMWMSSLVSHSYGHVGKIQKEINSLSI